MSWHYELPPAAVGGGQLELETHPDSREQAGVPKFGETDAAVVEPDLRRNDAGWWVYVPAQSQRRVPRRRDGLPGRRRREGLRAPVFDNLIAKREMPVTVGVFIQPACSGGRPLQPKFEYDTLSDQYARFLLEEICPRSRRR